MQSLLKDKEVEFNIARSADPPTTAAPITSRVCAGVVFAPTPRELRIRV